MVVIRTPRRRLSVDRGWSHVGFHYSVAPRHPPSLPTRRSSDLPMPPRPSSRTSWYCAPSASAAKTSRSHAPSSPLTRSARSEEHTSELQSRPHLVCRLLVEKQNNL